MSDPEAIHRRITSGDPGAVTAAVDQLLDVRSGLRDAASSLRHAASIPVWSGAAAAAFTQRAAQLQQGALVTAALAERARGALDTAAGAQASAIADADQVISVWRNRPRVLPGPVEDILASLVTLQLTRVAASYDTQLAAVDAVVNGEDVDLDALDDETREWVEQGLEKNEEWLDGPGSESGLGPVIPNVAAVGDDRGLVPQGLGITDDGHLLQSYYREDGNSVIAVVDPVTGEELNEVEISDGVGGTPGHVGGVTVVGNQVYVADTGGTTYVYDLADLTGPSSGPVEPSGRPLDLEGGSYNAFHDGRYFSGDWENNVMHVYERRGGEWVKVSTVPTPEDTQGVVVRDGEYVFSASGGRTNPSSLVVQDRFDSNDRSEPYPLPNMSQGVVEHDGQLITSYESGAEEYDHGLDNSIWPWVEDDDDKLWANPYYTTTPLDALLDPTSGAPLEVDPASLASSSAAFAGAGDQLRGAASAVAGVSVGAHAFGDVPAGPRLGASITATVDRLVTSLRAGGSAVELLTDSLDGVARAYVATDDAVGTSFARLTG